MTLDTPPRSRSDRHRRALDGGAAARDLLRPLAARVHQIRPDGDPRVGAWPAVARMLSLPPGSDAALRYLWRGDRPLTDLWRARLSGVPPTESAAHENS